MTAPDRLLVWAAASFHAALIVAGLVTYLHAQDAAGAVFGDFGTGTGFAVYVYLWVLSTWSARRVLHDATVTPDGFLPAAWELLGRAAAWGAAAGALFVAGAGAALAIAAGMWQALFFVLTFPVVAGGIAGALVGAALGAVDVGIFALAHRLLPPSSGPSTP